jgi:arylsulfatase A-like enzyme
MHPARARTGPSSLVPSLAPLAALAVVACSRPEPPPSVVLVTLDTTRADHLGCYGYFRETTPFLDALAERAILFERCIVPMATTLPTHATILTGTWPLEHGVLANLQHTGHYFEPAPGLRSFAELCRASGWRTAAFVGAAPLRAETGIAAGFEHFDEPSAEVSQRTAAQTNEALFAWLDALPADERRPLFLWVHYYDPHWPFEPPPEYVARFRTDERLERWVEERRVPSRVRRPLTEEVDDALLVRNLYDAELRYLDDRLAELFARLERLPGFERAAVLVIGDHGEGLCQHGETAHGSTWNEQLHAPFLLLAPGEAPRRVPWPVSAADALPTLLGRIEAPALAPFLAQASGRDALAEGFRPRPLVSQDTGRRMGDPQAGAYRFSLTGERWKLVRAVPAGELERPEPGRRAASEDARRSLGALGYAGGEGEQGGSGAERYALYDLAADPFELEDVAAEHPEIVEQLARELQRELERQRARARELGER